MTIGRIAGILFSVAFLGYFGIQFGALARAPSLELYSPTQGLITSSKSIEIAGKTLPGALVLVNNTQIPINQDGSFSKRLVLGNGVNKLVIEAKKRYSRARTIARDIFILDGEKLSGGAQAGI